MSIKLNVSPQTESKLFELAQREGIDTTALIEKMVREYTPHNDLAPDNELSGKTLGESYGHLMGTVNIGPADLAARDEEYLQLTGFGEITNRRGLGQ